MNHPIQSNQISPIDGYKRMYDHAQTQKRKVQTDTETLVSLDRWPHTNAAIQTDRRDIQIDKYAYHVLDEWQSLFILTRRRAEMWANWACFFTRDNRDLHRSLGRSLRSLNRIAHSVHLLIPFTGSLIHFPHSLVGQLKLMSLFACLFVCCH